MATQRCSSWKFNRPDFSLSTVTKEEEFSAIVGSFCPNILFPYAREAVASVVQKGGFPEFVLQPINFDSLYMQSRQQLAAKEAEGEDKH